MWILPGYDKDAINLLLLFDFWKRLGKIGSKQEIYYGGLLRWKASKKSISHLLQMFYIEYKDIPKHTGYYQIPKDTYCHDKSRNNPSEQQFITE